MNSKKKSQTQSDQSLVSVIMPVYNGEKFVGEAIESVINQTYENWELIIVNDGSTDNSKAVVAPYLNDGRIKFIQHERNKGIPTARNTGINTSKGEYLSLLDQDDVWTRNKLEIQMRKFTESDSDLGLIFGKIMVMNSNGKVFKSIDSGTKLDLVDERETRLKKLFLGSFTPSVTAIFKKECIDEVGAFDENITWGGDDYDLWLRIAGKFKIAYINEVLAIRRKHGENFSRPIRMPKRTMEMTDKIIQRYPELAKYKSERLGRLYYLYGRAHHLAGNYSKARQLYAKSIVNSPFVSWKPYAAYFLTLLNLKFNRSIRHVK